MDHENGELISEEQNDSFEMVIDDNPAETKGESFY